MEKLFDAEGLTSSERYFYTPSSFARKHLCYMQEVGTLRSLKPHASVRENLESFLFFYVKSGNGCVRYEGQETQLKKGDAVLLDCRRHYEHESSAASPWELAWVHFDGARAEALYPLFWKDNGEKAVIPLGKQEKLAEELITKLLQTKGENSRQTEVCADAMIGRILLLCMEQAVAGRDAAAEFDGLREALNEELAKPFDGIASLLEALSERYGAAKEQIEAAFLKKYGITIEGYAANRMMNKAKELLRFTIKTVDEVAREAGFENEERLRIHFMENEELSPEDYRKKWAQWIKG